MTPSPINQAPFLRTSRNFPIDPQALSIEVDRSYIDIANTVNDRVIGIYAVNRPVVNGKSFFLNAPKQQGLQQVYEFGSAGSFPHGINTAQIGGFTAIYGSFSDGTNFYPLPYVDATAATNQVQVVVTPTNIVITIGAGSPAIVTGTVVLEWRVVTR